MWGQWLDLPGEGEIYRAATGMALAAVVTTQEMGVDVALNQADLMAHLIAEEMSLGDMMTLLKLRKGNMPW